ncbi:MAG: hypothetical protein J3R72DRAFT_195363 [Linnemannia gamsii]|nr:MAG: hypothetical protein J3R72DRAFT_195363 [Linnemannia gamsii]
MCAIQQNKKKKNLHSSLHHHSSLLFNALRLNGRPHRRRLRSPEEYERLLDLHASFKPVWFMETIQLGPWLSSDRDVLVEFLNDPRVYSFFFRSSIPLHPQGCRCMACSASRQNDQVERYPVGFAFRDMARGGKAVGCISISDERDDALEGDDIGY